VTPAAPTNAPSRLLQICAVDFTAFHFLLPLMRAQREWGLRVELACARGEFAERIEAEGFPLHDVPFARSVNPSALLGARRALSALLARERFDAVHLHTPVAALIGRPAARRARVPVIVYTAHGFYFHDAMPAWKRRAHVALERWAQRRADYLFTQSAEDAATAVRERISPADRTLAIGNGVDLARFRPDLLNEKEKEELRAELNLAPDDGPLVVMMGRIVREKGYFEFIEAWARVAREHPRARALLIGEALTSDRENAEARLRRRAEELGVSDSILWLGPRGDVPRLLAAADLFALPSWREGMPRSIVEAMASGLPVVASDIRGCREEVVEGETGRLVPARDAEALGRALVELLGDAEARRRMGQAGRRRAEAEFDERLVIERQREAFRALFEEKGLSWPP
jgi:glycosyltransferase involved in cell wall biosynthesis